MTNQVSQALRLFVTHYAIADILDRLNRLGEQWLNGSTEVYEEMLELSQRLEGAERSLRATHISVGNSIYQVS